MSNQRSAIRPLRSAIGAFCILAVLATVSQADPPSSFDLRNVDGVNYVTSVRSQIGSTCWCFGTMGAFEGSMMMNGAWIAGGDIGKPNMAEYHLDWWNGFNKFNNDDIDPNTGDGLEVHFGGDYRVATAYFTRGDGAVRDVDGQSFDDPPPRWTEDFHVYYPRDVIWMTAEEDLSNINTIKYTIMEHGTVAMCMAYHASLISNFHHYQPPGDEHPINHSITIVGWDDAEPTPAPLPGAWLVKNSWGSSWGFNGYFWVSYYDQAAAQHAEMGCVSFQGIELTPYDHTYYHDYHGWRDTLPDATEAFNAFVGADRHRLQAVAFYTAEDEVDYTLKIYDRFEGGELLDELASQSGTIAQTGYHTIDLETPIYLFPDDMFYIYVQLSHGGLPYDCTGEVSEMMGATTRAIVTSTASPGESLYREGGTWLDLTDFNDSANFCIKGLAVEVGLEVSPEEDFTSEGSPGGPFAPATKTYQLTNTDSEPISYEVTTSPCTPWMWATGQTSGMLEPGGTAEVTVEIYDYADLLPPGLHRSPVNFVNNSTHLGDTTLLTDLIVGPVPVQYEWTFDQDPDWTTRGDWNWGQPAGNGGENGYPDPSSGHTGSFVYGYNLNGDYPNNLGFKHLTTDGIDCTGLSHVRLAFWRWLGVEHPDNDQVAVRISPNGSDWTVCWTNETEVTDSGWVYQEIDVSHIADNRPDFHVRWTMGSTDDSGTYCGWNLDDVRILGFEAAEPIIGDLNGDGVVDIADLATLLGSYGDTGVNPEDGDLDGDGDVDLNDLAILLGYYGCTEP